MYELILVGLLTVGLVGLGALSLLSWQSIFGLGVGLVILGMSVGVPAGLGYHVQLHRALSPRGALPPRWWLRPDRFHRALLPAEVPPVMRWFRVGAAGFVVAVIGCAVVLLSAVRWE